MVVEGKPEVQEPSIEEHLEQAQGGVSDEEGKEEQAQGSEGAKEGEEPSGGEQDSEIELPFGKYKVSDLKTWQKSHESYTQKMQGLSQQEQEVATLRELSSFLKSNPEKARRVIEILDEAEDKAIAEGATPKQAEDAMAKVIENLDPDDPQSALIKAMYDSQKTLLAKIEAAEKREHQFSQQSQQQQYQQQVKKASSVLNDTLNSSFKELKMEDKDESEMVRQMTLSYLKDNPKDYKNEEEFVSTVREVVAQQKQTLDKVGEKKVAAYLKTKRSPSLPAGGSDGDKTPKEPSVDNLQESLETMLEEEMAKK